MTSQYTPSPRLCELVDALCASALTPADLRELDALLLDDEPARDFYMNYCRMHAELAFRMRSQAAVTAAVLGIATPTRSVVSGTALAAGDKLARRASEGVSPSKLARSASEGVKPNVTQGDSPIFAQQKLGQSPATFYISAIAAAVAFIAIGILAYSFWPSPAVLPVVHQNPAAKIVNLTDAKWTGASLQVGGTLSAGQRLILQSGSAEITFNKQARVIVEGPTELTIVDAASCRLAGGKLVAHVPDPAKGFQVHTPGGTVTDLGTEFGVYVSSEAAGVRLEEVGEVEQQPGGGVQFDDQPTPVTEVHVFKGKVDVASGDQLAQAPGQENPPPKSELRNQKSKILSAGQAVTISNNKLQPLPAADPFKFALDKLNGRPRKVLLAEDFESLPLGRIDQPRSGWITAGTTRKGQGIGMIDPVARLAALGAKYPEATDGQLFFGNRVASVAFTGLPPNAPPLLAHEINGRELSGRCQVLIQFDIMSESKDFSVSLAIASALQPDEKIAFEKKAKPSAPGTEWPIFQWYRVRLLLDVAESKVHGIRAERLKLAGKEGWVHDRALNPPMPQLDWTTPPRYVVLGMPTSDRGGGGIYWLDNVRMEVLPGK